MNKFKGMLNDKNLKMTDEEFEKAIKNGIDSTGKCYTIIDFFWKCRDRVIDNIDDERDRKAYFHFARWHYEEIMELEEQLRQIIDILDENPDILGVHVANGYNPLENFEFIWRKK